MNRYYDGDKLLEDVSRALEEALGNHGVQVYSLLGVTTVLEAIASPLKLHRLQGKAGQEMGRLGQEAYYASTIPRRVALLQSPHSETVNPMMESIVVARPVRRLRCKMLRFDWRRIACSCQSHGPRSTRPRRKTAPFPPRFHPPVTIWPKAVSSVEQSRACSG